MTQEKTILAFEEIKNLLTFSQALRTCELGDVYNVYDSNENYLGQSIIVYLSGSRSGWSRHPYSDLDHVDLQRLRDESKYFEFAGNDIDFANRYNEDFTPLGTRRHRRTHHQRRAFEEPPSRMHWFETARVANVGDVYNAYTEDGQYIGQSMVVSLSETGWSRIPFPVGSNWPEFVVKSSELYEFVKNDRAAYDKWCEDEERREDEARRRLAFEEAHPMTYAELFNTCREGDTYSVFDADGNFVTTLIVKSVHHVSENLQLQRYAITTTTDPVLEFDSLADYTFSPSSRLSVRGADLTYTDASDVPVSDKSTFDQRSETFRHEDHMNVNNNRDWVWGEAPYEYFIDGPPVNKNLDDLPDKAEVIRRAHTIDYIDPCFSSFPTIESVHVEE